jgi:hypothetical protein
MTSKSRAQVDKEIHIRRLGGKVKVAGTVSNTPHAARKVQIPKPRSVAQIDKEVLARQMGRKVPARGRLSDAATGRLHGTSFDSGEHPRDRKGRFR